MKEVIYGACAKHPNHSMINCPMCELEKYKVKEMTQETMTKEQILEKMIEEMPFTLPMACIPYIKESMEIYHQQQLSAELEAHKKEIELILSAVARGENLADSLNFDGKSELDKERERAGKLVELLKEVDKSLYIGDDLNDIDILHWYINVITVIKDEIKQTLNEYDTATKES